MNQKKRFTLATHKNSMQSGHLRANNVPKINTYLINLNFYPSDSIYLDLYLTFMSRVLVYWMKQAQVKPDADGSFWELR